MGLISYGTKDTPLPLTKATRNVSDDARTVFIWLPNIFNGRVEFTHNCFHTSLYFNHQTNP